MSTKISFLNPAELGPARGYSHLAQITSGNLVLLSGQVGVDSANPKAPLGNFETQTNHVFANLQKAATAIGGTFADIAKLTIYIVDTVPRTELGPLLTAINRHSGSGSVPASTLIFVSGLIYPELLIEVEAVLVSD